MTPEDFAAWVRAMEELNGWSGRECSRRLGCGVNQITKWKAEGAPLYIGLACAALAMNVEPWTAAKDGPAPKKRGRKS